jgi:S-adenosylmethionine:diacylglycerol 3-amino-3-carboxypropyl transferase
MSGTEIFKQASDLMFGQVREDALVDLFLVGSLDSPQKAFVIASGGCTALSLLLQEGLEIDAVDISQAQVSLVETKIEMFKNLGAEAAAQACCADAASAFAAVKKHLSESTQNIIAGLPLKNGLNNSGSVDRRMSQITKLFYTFVHSKAKTVRFLELADVDAQREYYQKQWSNFIWRVALKIAFSKAFLSITHGKVASTIVPDDFAEVMEARLVKALTAYPNARNPYLWQAFFGQYNNNEMCRPPYLQSENQKTIIANLARLHLTCADTLEWFGEQPANSIDYFGLSNIVELLPPEYAAKLRHEIIRCARPGALVCVRAIFPRKQPVWSDESPGSQLAGARLQLDNNLGDQAEKMDRSLFCNFYEIYRCL